MKSSTKVFLNLLFVLLIFSSLESSPNNIFIFKTATQANFQSDTEPKIIDLEANIQPGTSNIIVDNSLSLGKVESRDVVKGKLPDLEINDFRGSAEGWSVTVKASQFKDGNYKLDDSNNKLVVGNLNKLPLGVLSLEPGIVVNSNKTGSNSNINIYNTKILLDDGNSHQLFQADEGYGLGTHKFMFNNETLIFEVPRRTKTGVYKSTITWTLMLSSE